MRDQCKRPIQRLLLTTRLPGTVAAHACGRAGTTWPKVSALHRTIVGNNVNVQQILGAVDGDHCKKGSD
eukprot:scaffold102090_cov17-Tisochrysis_lutea.AAC.1